jgi:hypothetical protein
MPIRPFKDIPADVVQWSKFLKDADVTPSDESVGKDQLIDGEVTFAKIQNVEPDRLLGRDTSPAGTVQELEVTGGLEFTGSGIQRSELTGDIVAGAGDTVTEFREGAAASLLGRFDTTIGPIADIESTVDGQVLKRVAGALLFQALGISDIANLVSGTYTPTLTNTTNLDGTTAYACQYMRVGSVVTVSGRIDVNPTAGASTVVGISLPIASNFSAPEQCGGVAFCQTVAGQGAAIFADATNDRAQMEWIAVDIGARGMFFSFTYQII